MGLHFLRLEGVSRGKSKSGCFLSPSLKDRKRVNFFKTSLIKLWMRAENTQGFHFLSSPIFVMLGWGELGLWQRFFVRTGIWLNHDQNLLDWLDFYEIRLALMLQQLNSFFYWKRVNKISNYLALPQLLEKFSHARLHSTNFN